MNKNKQKTNKQTNKQINTQTHGRRRIFLFCNDVTILGQIEELCVSDDAACTMNKSAGRD